MTVPADLDARFRDRAAAEGLLDVAYGVADSPVGELFVAVSPLGVCRIAFDADPAREAERLARLFGQRVLGAPRPIDQARRELDDYFEGRRTAFAVPLDLRSVAPFQQRVLDELARVGYGTLDTYGGLAQRIGNPRAARAVGGALNRNPIPIVLPCHRIVGAGGRLVGYGGGLERKRALLALEGLAVDEEATPSPSARSRSSSGPTR